MPEDAMLQPSAPRRRRGRMGGTFLLCLGALAGEVPSAANSPRPILLDPLTVTGTRIVRDRPATPTTTAVTYDAGFIAATGAQRLTDFLQYVPQNYTGASAGRGSAPNEFNPESGVRSESSLPPFNIALGASAVPFGQTGVSGANLRGLGSGSTLVLVDGRRQPIAGQGNRGTDTRQAFVDLNTIPLGAIERVEVLSDGASALYGSDAIGGVINVILKKDFRGAELVADHRGAFAGGGSERRIALNAGFTAADARLSGMFSAEVYDRSALKGAQRPFSAEQDHRNIVVGITADGTPAMGRDLRVNWGYPAVVQARSGMLNGVLTSAGAATPVALVPARATSTPRPGDFIGVAATTGAGQRRMNTAEFLTLIPEQATRHASLNLNYTLGPATRLWLRASGGDVRGRFDGQPPVSAASASSGFGNFSTIVPATIDGQPNPLNPFGQDVFVGMVHVEFGPVHQTTETRTHSMATGVTGGIGNGWLWEATVGSSRQRFSQRTHTLDFGGFTNALGASDQTQRFNPFIDALAAGRRHARIYADLVETAGLGGESVLHTASVSANGPLRRLRAGELLAAAGVDFTRAEHETRTLAASGAITAGEARQTTRAVFAESLVPVFRPLDLQLALRHERHQLAGESTVPRLAAVWTPAPGLVVRAGVAQGFRAPSPTEYQARLGPVTSTVVDPRRSPANTPGVRVTRGANVDATAERSRTETAGFAFSPRVVPGLTLTLDFQQTTVRNTLQQLSPQTLVNNEPLLPERIHRAPPTPADIATNQPGAIIGIDATFVNFGELRQQSVDLRLDYDRQLGDWGRVRSSLAATRTLGSETRLRPGAAAVELVGDTGAPPRSRGYALVMWQRGEYDASAFLTHLGGFTSNQAGNALALHGSPSHTELALRFGRTFPRGIWRGYGKDARIGAGIGNVFDREPPFSDTIFGYNGGLHSPLGRTYEVRLTLKY